MYRPLFLSLCLCLTACSTASVVNPQTLPKPDTQLSSAVSRTVVFRVADSAFGLKEAINAGFCKLSITNGTETIWADQANEQGFVAIQSGEPGAEIVLSAHIPVGQNWTARFGFYNTEEEGQPLRQWQTAFHVNQAETPLEVVFSARTYLMSEMARFFRERNASTPVQFRPLLNLEHLLAFTDALTGAEADGDGWRFTRLTGGAVPAKPEELDALRLEYDVFRFVSTLEQAQTMGASTLPQNYHRPPRLMSSFSLDTPSAGLDEMMALNSAQGPLFFFHRDAEQQAYLHALAIQDNGNNLAPLQISRAFAPVSVGQVESRYPVVGLATPIAGERENALFLTRRVGANLELVALSQENGAVLWSYDAGPAETTSFTPLTWLDKHPDSNGNGGCGCDDEDILFMAVNRSLGQDAQILQVRGRSAGSILEGSYTYDGEGQARFDSSGTFSADGSKLYVLNHADAAELIVIDVATMQGVRHSLAPYTLEPGISPVLGRNDTVYLALRQGNQGYLQAFSATGANKWTTPVLLSESAYASAPPVWGIVSSQDLILTHTHDGQLHAVKDLSNRGSVSWRQQFDAPVVGSPLLGQQKDDALVVYSASRESGKFYETDFTTGRLNFSAFPDGMFDGSLMLFQKQLLLFTREGSRGQQTFLKSFHVSADKLPAQLVSKWPKRGGNLSNSGKY